MDIPSNNRKFVSPADAKRIFSIENDLASVSSIKNEGQLVARVRGDSGGQAQHPDEQYPAARLNEPEERSKDKI